MLAGRTLLVLTDLQMPGIDGIELCRTLRERVPALPVIVTTGFGDTRSAVRAMREGATDYLQKPLDLDAVLLGIQDATSSGRRRAWVISSRLCWTNRGFVAVTCTWSARGTT
jgi:FixJ family two-component response regulator